MWSGQVGPGAVKSWDRPVDDVLLLPCKALRPPLVRGRKKQVVPRCFPVPKGMHVAVLVSTEANPQGGLRRVGRLLMRRAGWALPAAWFDQEPVLLAQGTALPSAGTAVDWTAHPAEEPWRPEVAQPELISMLESRVALLGDQPHMVLKGRRAPLALAVQDPASVMWVAAETHIERRSLAEACTLPRVPG